MADADTSYDAVSSWMKPGDQHRLVSASAYAQLRGSELKHVA